MVQNFPPVTSWDWTGLGNLCSSQRTTLSRCPINLLRNASWTRQLCLSTEERWQSIAFSSNCSRTNLPRKKTLGSIAIQTKIKDRAFTMCKSFRNRCASEDKRRNQSRCALMFKILKRRHQLTYVDEQANESHYQLKRRYVLSIKFLLDSRNKQTLLKNIE